MLELYWKRRAPFIHGLPFDGFSLDNRPQVELANNGAGNVTTGTHRYKFAWVTASGTTLCGDASKTITTDTASTGQVAIMVPGMVSGGALGWPLDYTGNNNAGLNIYRTEAGGSTYKLLNAAPITTQGAYIDNIADGSLGAAEPGANTTSGTTLLSDPTTVESRVAALTAGSGTDLLVARLIMQYQWHLLAGASNNAALFVPGAWVSDSTVTYRFPHDPQRRYWAPTDSPVTALTIPAYSTDWAELEDLIEFVSYNYYIRVTLDFDTQTSSPNEYTITVIPEGGSTFTESISYADRADVPLVVCQQLLLAVHDPDWY